MSYTLMSKDSIQYLCGLIRNLANVSEGIDDLNLHSDSTFSSVKINTLLNTLKTDCNEYTDRLVANLSRLELKLVTDESDITDSNILYLYKPDGATSYNQYVVIDGTKVLLGTCDINMGDYYTISQADDKFALKIDLDVLTTSFNDLVTSVDNKIDKDKIVTVLDDTVTDEQVPSARIVVDELNTKANDDEVVKKTDIATTIDSDSTDDKVPSAKAINELNLRGTLIDQSVIDKYGIEIIKYPCGRWYFTKSSIANKFNDIPWNEACIIDITSINPKINPWDNAWAYRNYKVQTISKKGYFIRQLESSETAGTLSDTGWQRVCTTTVGDVARTDIILSDETNYQKETGTDRFYYVVKNGVCYVNIDMRVVSSSDTWLTLASLPKPIASPGLIHLINTWSVNNFEKDLGVQIDKNGVLKAIYGANDCRYIDAFSYPVAES